MPLIIAGDLNSTASGPHLPDKDWTRVPAHKRRHKGWQPGGPGTPWTADPRALDTLIGAWSPAAGRRKDSPGLHALAEDDWIQRGRPDELLVPTTNTGADQGGSLLIDWILRNGRVELVPGTYRVHIPRPGLQHTDHRLVTATIALPAGT